MVEKCVQGFRIMSPRLDGSLYWVPAEMQNKLQSGDMLGEDDDLQCMD